MSAGNKGNILTVLLAVILILVCMPVSRAFADALSVTTGSLPDGTVGVSYSCP